MTRFRAPVLGLSLTAATTVAAVMTSFAPAAYAARPAPAPTRGAAAAGWLARQLTGRSHFVFVFGGKTFANQGGTIDAIFAFAATRSAQDFGNRATTWLKQPKVLSGYLGTKKTGMSAGATAKVALAAEVQGIDPTKFGGVDLLTRLSALLTKSGRYSDTFSSGDFSNAFSQSLAILAVSRHGHAPKSAVSFLIASECKNGGFPLNFGEKKCASDPDSTALDAQALLAAGRKLPAQRGLHWLAADQRADGGFSSGAKAAANANSTGLAGEALAAGGWRRPAARAAKFLLSLQLGCASSASKRGAIVFDKTGFKQSTAVEATAQGILGLADVPLWALSSARRAPGRPETGMRVVSAVGAGPANWVPAPQRAVRWTLAVAALCLLLTAALLVGVTRATPAYAAGCSGKKGITVVVDFSKLHGKVRVGCDSKKPSTGLAALRAAGFKYTFVPRQPGFVCTINRSPKKCNGAPTSAYWSYWHASPHGKWKYSTLGAGSFHPKAGSVEGWAFGKGKPPKISPP